MSDIGRPPKSARDCRNLHILHIRYITVRSHCFDPTLLQHGPTSGQPGPTYRPSKCNLVPFGRNFGPSSVPHGLNVWGMASRTPRPKTRVFTCIFLLKHRWSFMLAANLMVQLGPKVRSVWGQLGPKLGPPRANIADPMRHAENTLKTRVLGTTFV